MIYKETANRMQVSIHSLDDCIPDDHIVRVPDLFVDKLSNLDFGFKEYDRPESLGGRPAFHWRTQHQDAIDRNNARVTGKKELYNQRQAICEHPFGTIKRQWGYSYTLLKGKEKVNGEMALIFLTYNLRRCVSILSIKELLRRLKNRQPPEGRPKTPSPGRKKRSKRRFLSSLSALMSYCRYYPVPVRHAIALSSTPYYLN
jgi:hypothetical protein